MPGPAWLKKQKRIAAVARDRESYFTVGMMEKLGAVYGSVRGLDPNKPEGGQEDAWFEKRRARAMKNKTRDFSKLRGR